MSSTGLLTIDVGAIADNWQSLSARVGPQCECSAVVKANAYGLGADVVVRALAQRGCQTFFVSTVDEGVALRKALGVAPDIYVLGGVFHGLSDDVWLDDSLTPVLFERAHVDLWLAYARRHQRPLPCALKVDTGMHRLGMSEGDALAALVLLSAELPAPAVCMISHLACADMPEHGFNSRQLSAFVGLVDRVVQGGFEVRYSLANSSGIFLGQSFHFDMVRPGAALYGINPTPGRVNSMSSVVQLRLPIMQKRLLDAGESVGYGAAFTAAIRMPLLVVFGGYADGVLATLGRRGYAYCEGVRLPIVGRVSMDSMVFDASALSPQAYLDCDGVDVFGADEDFTELAASVGAVGYELLTSLGNRYRRHYVGSAK